MDVNPFEQQYSIASVSSSPEPITPVERSASASTTPFPSIDMSTPQAEVSRPSVHRASSAPESLSADSSLLFTLTDSDRPLLPRACSESLAIGVLERRRRKAMSENGTAPLNMMLDFAGLSRTMGTGNISFLKAARKAAAEPCEWDWGYGEAGPSRYGADIKRQDRGHFHAPDTIPSPQRLHPIQSSRSSGCYGFNSEFEWAVGGHNRLSQELYRSDPQDKDSEEVYLAMQAKFASQLPETGRRFRPRLKALRVAESKAFRSCA